jgi:magnesium transporter
MLKLKGNEGEEQEIEVEQVSFVLGHGWLLSFQEVEGDVFETIRKRLRDQTSPLRKNNIDYLFYRLVDTIVDNYFAVIEYLGERMEDLEEEIMVAPNEDLRWKMQVLRKEIVQLRKSVVPLREAIGVLAKEENHFVKKATTRYFLDVFEHVIQLTDYIDTQRDMLSSLVDLYLSGVSFKMNQVMKVLTIISTIFIPLTFIAGIYGMNFEYMPELHWANGYFGTLAVMVVMVIGMLFYFKRKDWL